jgi:hypothetical protein
VPYSNLCHIHGIQRDCRNLPLEMKIKQIT